MSVVAHPPHPLSRLAVGLVVLWLASAAAGFWWFAARDMRPFAGELAEAEQAFAATVAAGRLQDWLTDWRQRHPQALRPGGLVLLHFWDPGCPCSRFNNDHVRQLLAAPGSADVQLMVLTSAGAAAAQVQTVFGPTVVPVPPDQWQAIATAVPASPAAAVFDGSGRLAYLGPYSEGAACLAGNGDFVEQTLSRLRAGDTPTQLNMTAFGCFCRWTPHPVSAIRQANDGQDRSLSSTI